MEVALFDFELPPERIALRPARPRDSARLMIVFPDGRIAHRLVRDLPEYLDAGDALVLNDTRVIPARLHGRRLREGGDAKIELLLHRRLAPDRFAALARPAKKLATGDRVLLGGFEAQVTARGEAGAVELQFSLAGVALDAAIAVAGEMPLPPYIASKRSIDAEDRADYQTLFARAPGSVAAPTAGLHFTPQLFERLAEKGVGREMVTLEVGLGTFLPVTAADTGKHRMHAENAEIAEAAAARLNAVRAAGHRVVAVGTTSLRTLESAAAPDGKLHALAGETDIFITPGYRFRAVDALLTNFHLPRSTLFMLVAAFSGLERMQAVYAEAIARQYRFYSYGDACLLFRPS